MSNHAYIYDAVRTPRSKGKKDGKLHEVKPIELGAGLLRELRSRHDLDTAYVDDVMLGCVTPVGEQGSNIAKLVVQQAGWDESIAGVTLDRYCASGLEAFNSAAQNVMSGWNRLMVAGGVESMSRVPMGSNGGAFLMDPEFVLTQRMTNQGVAADMVATIEGFDREDVDAYALESQKRASHAWANGYFDGSVVPVTDSLGMNILDKDDYLKPDTTMEGLAALKPSFVAAGSIGMDHTMLSKYNEYNAVQHVHTAGNSSGIVDGASAVLVGSEQAGKDLGLTARARAVAGAVTSTCPTLMMVGAGAAAKKCLDTAGLTSGDIDLWEMNEAFAAAAMRFMRDLDISHEITNVNGGAIAMGHPLGATGVILLGTMLDELERAGKRRALIALCAGAGIGIAAIIERV
jgi:acetyl-CoA C-acetyltransferase